MSMRSALASEVCAYRGRVIRIVEAQHQIATNRLATNADDQALLEALADDVKPLLPAAAHSLPWLLAAPFRYGLGRPSRFRAANVLPGIFYASESIETAVVEAAHWRLIAFARSPGFRHPSSPTQMSAFSVIVDSETALDLTRGELAKRSEDWLNPNDYDATQALAAEARAIGIELLRAPSARLSGGINLVVVEPKALVPPPKPHSSWAFLFQGNELIATREIDGKAIRYKVV